MSEMSEPIVRIDRGIFKQPIEASFAVTQDLVETVDTELAYQKYDPLPNPIYEFRPHILPGKGLNLAVVRLVEIEGGQLEQETQFGCAVDHTTSTFYLTREQKDGRLRLYVVEPDPVGTFMMFQIVALERATQTN